MCRLNPPAPAPFIIIHLCLFSPIIHNRPSHSIADCSVLQHSSLNIITHLETSAQRAFVCFYRLTPSLWFSISFSFRLPSSNYIVFHLHRSTNRVAAQDRVELRKSTFLFKATLLPFLEIFEHHLLMIFDLKSGRWRVEAEPAV